ncbi:MAG: lytic murein transglycosylase [Nanoarchaeota archaeon]
MKNLIKILSLATFLALPQIEIKAQSDKIAQKEIILKSEEDNNLLLLTDYLSKKGFKIDSLLKDSRFKIYDGISNRFKKAPEIKINNLEKYKEIIGYTYKKEKISGFMNNNLEKLLEAEKKYGIPKETISSILGIESDFGEITGKYNPFNVYISLYIEGYKKEFAKTQLEELLIFCKKKNLDIFNLNSSYAGAISYGQFIPSSLNRWFIGSDLYSMDNNILSVANYLFYFKKRTGTLEKAIYSYNPSKLYVQAVIALAKEAESKK